jgi:hypothetical protein
MLLHKISSTTVFISLVTTSFTVNAQPFSIIESKPLTELWLNLGFYSYHFQKEKDLNNRDFGLGGEYRFSTVSSVTLGLIDNSKRKTTHYAGWYWQPVGMGKVRLGAVAGAMDGYPNMRNGGWFVSVIPTASFEFNNVGLNLMYIPSYQDKIYGSISVQLKLKVF